jgi:ribosomal protein S27AE
MSNARFLALIAQYGIKTRCPGCGQSTLAELRTDAEGTFTECPKCGTFDVDWYERYRASLAPAVSDTELV